MNEATHRSNVNGITLRAASLEDIPAITAMLDAASQAVVGRPTSTEEVGDRLATPNSIRERDTVLAYDGEGTLVGFGHVWPAQPDEIRCFGRTHPQQRGKGAGTAVQQALIARAAELAGMTEAPELTKLTTTTWANDTAGEGLLRSVGYLPVRYFQKMVSEFSEAPPAALPDPTGLALRAFTPGDETALFAAFVEAFAEHWGEERVDEATWWLDRRDADSAGYAPDLWVVALDGDEMAGFVTARIQQDSEGRSFGYVCDLGVRPGWRGRGLGECLLTRSLRMLHERGLPCVALDVDTENTTGAIRLYTKMGMQHQPSFTIWSRSLGTETDATG